MRLAGLEAAARQGKVRGSDSADLLAVADGLEPALGHCEEPGGMTGRKCPVETEDPAIRAVAVGTSDREGGAEAAAVGRVCRGRDDVLAHGNGAVWNLVRSIDRPETGQARQGAAWGGCESDRGLNAREQHFQTAGSVRCRVAHEETQHLLGRRRALPVGLRALWITAGPGVTSAFDQP